jgi:hypothetical protein
MFSGLDMKCISELQNGACSEVNIGQFDYYQTSRLAYGAQSECLLQSWAYRFGT